MRSCLLAFLLLLPACSNRAPIASQPAADEPAAASLPADEPGVAGQLAAGKQPGAGSRPARAVRPFDSADGDSVLAWLLEQGKRWREAQDNNLGQEQVLSGTRKTWGEQLAGRKVSWSLTVEKVQVWTDGLVAIHPRGVWWPVSRQEIDWAIDRADLAGSLPRAIFPYISVRFYDGRSRDTSTPLRFPREDWMGGLRGGDRFRLDGRLTDLKIDADSVACRFYLGIQDAAAAPR
jgi:hypothetical protein